MDLAKEYYKCIHADVRPVSGVVANLVMYNAFTSDNNGKMCCMAIVRGGHISHGPRFAKSGREIYGTAGTTRGINVEYLAFDNDEMNLDIDASAKIIREFEPEIDNLDFYELPTGEQVVFNISGGRRHVTFIETDEYFKGCNILDNYRSDFDADKKESELKDYFDCRRENC